MQREPVGSSIVTSIDAAVLLEPASAASGALTTELAVGVLDAGLLGGLDVLLVGRVAGLHLDDGGRRGRRR